MKKYCKAYQLKDLKQFGAWIARNEADEPELTDEDIVYLWDDFTVVRNPVIPGKGLIFDDVTPAWQEFCRNVVGFAVPHTAQEYAQ